MAKLDKEERELLKSFEDGEWNSVSNKQREAGRLQDYAAATFKKSLSNSCFEHPSHIRVRTPT